MEDQPLTSAPYEVEILTVDGRRYAGRGVSELEALHSAVGAFASAAVTHDPHLCQLDYCRLCQDAAAPEEE